jgi:hypothetical protein
VHRGNRVLRKKLTKQKEKLTRLTCFGWFSSPGLTLRHTREDSLKIDWSYHMWLSRLVPRGCFPGPKW